RGAFGHALPRRSVVLGRIPRGPRARRPYGPQRVARRVRLDVSRAGSADARVAPPRVASPDALDDADARPREPPQRIRPRAIARRFVPHGPEPPGRSRGDVHGAATPALSRE